MKGHTIDLNGYTFSHCIAAIKVLGNLILSIITETLGSSIMRKKMSISRESPAAQVKEYSDSFCTVLVINLKVIRHSTPFLWLQLTFKTLFHDFIMVSKQSWMH